MATSLWSAVLVFACSLLTSAAVVIASECSSNTDNSGRNTECVTSNSAVITKRSIEDFQQQPPSYGLRELSYDDYGGGGGVSDDEIGAFDKRSEQRLNKNFLRFGRSGGGVDYDVRKRGSDSHLGKNFLRFGRGSDSMSDGEIRRFIDEIYSKRGALNKNFLRLGRSGGGGPSAVPFDFKRGKLDQNFIRFGRDSESFPGDEESSSSFGSSGSSLGSSLGSSGSSFGSSSFKRSAGLNKNFLRFGKRSVRSVIGTPTSSQQQHNEGGFESHSHNNNHNGIKILAEPESKREAALGKNFLRFGKRSSETNTN